MLVTRTLHVLLRRNCMQSRLVFIQVNNESDYCFANQSNPLRGFLILSEPTGNQTPNDSFQRSGTFGTKTRKSPNRNALWLRTFLTGRLSSWLFALWPLAAAAKEDGLPTEKRREIDTTIPRFIAKSKSPQKDKSSWCIEINRCLFKQCSVGNILVKLGLQSNNDWLSFIRHKLELITLPFG